MKVHWKNLQPSHEVRDEVEKKDFPTVTKLSAPDKQIPETDKSVAEKETITQPIPITCNYESSKELTEEIWSHEVAETSNYEVLLGAVGMENEVRDKNFEASATVESLSGFIDDDQIWGSGVELVRRCAGQSRQHDIRILNHVGHSQLLSFALFFGKRPKLFLNLPSAIFVFGFQQLPI